MFKSLPFFIGLRYILAKKDNRYISFTSLISMFGLTLGVLSIIVVLSVFNGSQGVMRERTLITVPHGNIASLNDFSDWQAALRELKTHADILGAAPYVPIEAMLSQQGFHQVTAIKAIAPEEEFTVSTIAENMVRGSLVDLVSGQNGIILGRTLADNMRLNMGDSVNLVVPSANANNTVSLSMHRFTVVGIFDPRFTIGSDTALIHLDDSLPLIGSDNLSERIQLRLRVNDVNNAAEIVEDAVTGLTQKFPGNEFVGTDWSVTEASLFNALKLEKIMTWFMLMMIVAIGAINIISTLVMVVSEKKADIAILRTMGAGAGTVMGIFVVQGTMVGIIGTFIGALAGVTLAINFSGLFSLLESVLSPASFYVVSALPSSLQSSDVWITCVAALVISFLATLYPALKASQILPAEVLRYE
jgi:lipoprotein-releasing system permease protein